MARAAAEAMKVAVITGGTQGIGLNFVRKFLACSPQSFGLVILAARNEARCQEALEAVREAIPKDGLTAVEALPCNMASVASVRAFCEAVRQRTGRVDLLVANAGLLSGRVFERATAKSDDGLELTFAVNHLSHFAMIQLLSPQLRVPGKARIVLTSAQGYPSAAPPRKGQDAAAWREVATTVDRCNCMQAYCDTKLANILTALELQRRYAGDGITATTLHPGAIRETGIWNNQLGGFMGFFLDYVMVPFGRLVGNWQTVDDGGDALLVCATSEDAAGRHRHVNKWQDLAPVGRDEKAAAALWEASEALLQELSPK